MGKNYMTQLMRSWIENDPKVRMMYRGLKSYQAKYATAKGKLVGYEALGLKPGEVKRRLAKLEAYEKLAKSPKELEKKLEHFKNEAECQWDLIDKLFDENRYYTTRDV